MKSFKAHRLSNGLSFLEVMISLCAISIVFTTIFISQSDAIFKFENNIKKLDQWYLVNCNLSKINLSENTQKTKDFSNQGLIFKESDILASSCLSRFNLSKEIFYDQYNLKDAILVNFVFKQKIAKEEK